MRGRAAALAEMTSVGAIPPPTSVFRADETVVRAGEHDDRIGALGQRVVVSLQEDRHADGIRGRERRPGRPAGSLRIGKQCHACRSGSGRRTRWPAATVSLTAVRRLAIAAQGYASRSRRARRAEVDAAVRRLSCVQLDSISAVERSHRIALGSRVGDYPA